MCSVSLQRRLRGGKPLPCPKVTFQDSNSRTVGSRLEVPGLPDLLTTASLLTGEKWLKAKWQMALFGLGHVSSAAQIRAPSPHQAAPRKGKGDGGSLGMGI